MSLFIYTLNDIRNKIITKFISLWCTRYCKYLDKNTV